MAFLDFVTRISLRRSILIALALPVLVLFFISSILLLEQWNKAQAARLLTRNMEMISALSSVVHEQQKERGASSVFLNSQGKQFGPELAAQREETQRALGQLDRALARFDAALLVGEDQRATFARISAALAQRSGILNAVDRQQIAPKEAIGYYTRLNGDMIDMVGDLGGLADDRMISGAVLSYKAFMIAKERAGIERAVGAGAFAAEAFPLATLLRLQQLVSEQDLSMQSFRRLAEEEQKLALDQAETAPASQHFRELRAIAFAMPETGDMKGVKGPDFFKAATARIDLLRGVENHVVGDLAELAARHEKVALTSFVALGAVVVLAGAVAVFFGLVLLRALVRSISELVEAATRMAAGDLATQVPQTGAPELLRISAALERFRDSILAARQAEAETRAAAAAQEAREHAAEQARLADTVARAEHEARESEALRQREQAYAREIAEVVGACARGDFSRRIELVGKDGVLAEICAGLNRIGEVANTGLGTIRQGLQRLADGDLTFRMESAQEGVFEEIAVALDQARQAMHQTLERVISSAAAVEVSTSEIAGAARDLSQRSENNAAMLEQTAASLSEMSDGVQKTATLSGAARGAARAIEASAVQGHDVVQKTISAIEEIQRSSRQIAQVLKVIDDIAFQTNLLALNAGVEAARAGEAGRGFTVVASEVRALAQRSSDAAREVAEMVTRSGVSVEQGVAMVNQSGSALTEIVGQVQSIVQQIEQIASASEDSGHAINDISRATAELDRSTQQNAAMFEQTSAAVSSLEIEARVLAQQAMAFRLEEGDGPAAQEASRPAAA
ncbi:MAG: nitrate- and nitrite sensing domain-containing protein [Paracoccaceae bacterium]